VPFRVQLNTHRLTSGHSHRNYLERHKVHSVAYLGFGKDVLEQKFSSWVEGLKMKNSEDFLHKSGKAVLYYMIGYFYLH